MANTQPSGRHRPVVLFAVRIALFLAAAWPCQGTEFAFRLAPAAAAASTTQATVSCSPVSGVSGQLPASLEPVERVVTVPWQGDVPLDPRAVWRVEVRAAGHWVAPLVVNPSRVNVAEMVLWPTGRVAGTLSTAGAEPVPAALTATFNPAPVAPSRRAMREPEGWVACEVKKPNWSCEVPAGKLDIRLRSPGYISHYRFGVAIPVAQSFEAGNIILRRGASVVGFVEDEEALAPPKGARAALKSLAAGLAAAPEDVARRDQPQDTTIVNDRGFFHFEAVKPGAYLLEVTKIGRAPARFAPVMVEQDSETRLRDSIVLRPPLTLRLRIRPALGINAEPWAVEVFEGGSAASALESIGGGKAEVDGTFSRLGLAPGPYTVRITDSRGDVLAWQEVNLERDAEIAIDLALTAVTGQAWLGDQPLSASLTFGGERGGVRVRLTSDEEGHFSGVLPHPGAWTVLVESRAQGVRRKMRTDVPQPVGEEPAPVELRLPATRLAGKAVDEAGQALPRAMIKVSDGQSAEVNISRSDTEGKFSFVGLPEGNLFADGYWQDPAGPELQAEPQLVRLDEDEDLEGVTLVLRKKTTFDGEVVSSAGAVPGAFILGQPKRSGREYPFAVVPQATTDMEGRFQLQLPSDYDSLDLIVMPPGFVLTLRHFTGRPSGLARVQVNEVGGTLVLQSNRSVEGEAISDPRPIAVFDGFPLDPALLKQWARVNGEANREATKIITPRMPAGIYLACWMELGDQLSIMSTGSTLASTLQSKAASGRCTSTELQALGESLLELPRLEEPAPDQRKKAAVPAGSGL